jgi:methionyl-tRNA formyltransferase
MRIVFMGSAELACPSLRALAGAPGHEVTLVITQPDRPKGRDLKPAPPPVKQTARQLGLTVEQPGNVREPGAVQRLRAARPELIIVVAYGQILPATVLEIAPHGCVNVHASLLPRWRGAAPIQYAILHGDRETGVTTMFMDERMDTGDIILQQREPIRPDDTSATLQERLARLGAKLLVQTVDRIAAGNAPRVRQDDAQASYARKISKDQGRIDWAQPAEQIERMTRAFDPWPGAHTLWDDKLLKIWKAELAPGGGGQPGELRPGGIVTTGAGGLKLLIVQPAGGRRMRFEDFLRGHPLAPGVVLR